MSFTLLVSPLWFFTGVVAEATPHSQTAPIAMSEPSNIVAAQVQRVMSQYQEMAGHTDTPVYAASQSLWFSTRRAQKRGPPSTAGFSSTGLDTPMEDVTTEAGGAEASSATPPPAATTRLFQPVPFDDEASVALTAAESGVNANDPGAVQQWLDAPVTTRRDVFQTVRAYHTSVIRNEMYNLVTQVESVIRNLDDRIIRQQADLTWLTSECRAEQKRQSGLQVLLTGWDPDMSPEDRHFMICWMMQQVEFFRVWLQRRGVQDTDPEHVFYHVLQVDPATPPSGSRWSTITILTFKSWDLRKSFMTSFGGSTGVGLWRDAQTHVRGRHIRATPCSPQFQRKLEVPLRVLLSLINESPLLEHSQVVVLWKTLTIMAPQAAREYDEQATAFARLFYFETQGHFKARLELCPLLSDACLAPPPAGAEESNMWEYSWNKVVWGVQLELDKADKKAYDASIQLAQQGQGVRYGKPTKHWSHPFVYSSETNPYPIEIHVTKVDKVAYCWDEYADKLSPDKKVGDYSASTYCLVEFGLWDLGATATDTRFQVPDPLRTSR